MPHVRYTSAHLLTPIASLSLTLPSRSDHTRRTLFTGARLTETYLSSSEVRHRLRGADDIVRYELRKGVEASRYKSWYDEAEGLVPPSVLGHIVRYGLYARDD